MRSSLLVALWFVVGCDRDVCTRQSDCPANETCTIASVCAVVDDGGVDAAPDAAVDAAIDAP